MIREEDVGDICATTAVQPPDYRVVLLDGAEFLIEVKNCHETTKPLRLKSSYIERLTNYGRLLNRPVKLAIYWSRWRVWTMVPLGTLNAVGGKATLSFPDAMMTNEMAVLGDHMIGTTPPLAIRLLTDPAKPRKATRRQKRLAFTIGDVELFCGGRRVEDKLEKAIVHHFMLFGNWPQDEHREPVVSKFRSVQLRVGSGDEVTDGVVGEGCYLIERIGGLDTVSGGIVFMPGYLVALVSFSKHVAVAVVRPLPYVPERVDLLGAVALAVVLESGRRSAGIGIGSFDELVEHQLVLVISHVLSAILEDLFDAGTVSSECIVLVARGVQVGIGHRLHAVSVVLVSVGIPTGVNGKRVWQPLLRGELLRK